MLTNLRDEAKHKPCMVRLPGCDGGKTTVLAHYRLAGYSGMGQKPVDIMGAWACHNCHDIIDGRKKTEHDQKIIRLAHAEGCLRTAVALAKAEIIKW